MYRYNTIIGELKEVGGYIVREYVTVEFDEL